MAFGGPFFNIKLSENDVPGASFGDRTADDCTMVQLQRWLECRGLKTSGTKSALIQRFVQAVCHAPLSATIVSLDHAMKVKRLDNTS